MFQNMGYTILAPVAQMASASFGMSRKFGSSRPRWVETFSVSKTSTFSRTRSWIENESHWHIYEQKYLYDTSVRPSLHLSAWLSIYSLMHASTLLYLFVLFFAFDYQFGILLQTENSTLEKMMRGTYPCIQKYLFAFQQVCFYWKKMYMIPVDIINSGS